ncbi:MAG: transposase, partial [Phycisphaerae bacterium]
KIAVEKGMARLFEQYRYFFCITNDRSSAPEEIVFQANDRCDQENGIEQLKNGVQAMRNPLGNRHSNWAYMVMSSLAWTLKAWCGLLLPVTPYRWESPHREQRHTITRMEFKRFRSELLRIPCQIVKTGRRIIYRIMSWNPWTSILLRLAEAMHYPMRC